MSLLVIVTTVFGVYVLQRIVKISLSLWKKTVLGEVRRASVPLSSRKTPVIKTYEISKEIERRIVFFENRTLAMSPIQEVFSPRTVKRDPAAEQPTLTRMANLEEVPKKSKIADKKSSTVLSLSDVILTIDIPPSPPSRVDDDDIVQLSELLRTW